MLNIYWTGCHTGSTRLPRRPQETPKSAPRGPKRAPEASKMAPRWPPRPPRGPQESPKSAPRGPQESPKRAQEASKMSPRGLYDGPHRPTRRSQSERSQMVFVLRRIFGGARFGGSWGLLVCAVLRGEFLSQIFVKVRASYRQLRMISALRKSGCFRMGWWGIREA